MDALALLKLLETALPQLWRSQSRGSDYVKRCRKLIDATEGESPAGWAARGLAVGSASRSRRNRTLKEPRARCKRLNSTAT